MASNDGKNFQLWTLAVDLMRHLDSRLSAREQLANELNDTGDWLDKAALNDQPHEQVWNLAENGVRIPADYQYA